MTFSIRIFSLIFGLFCFAVGSSGICVQKGKPAKLTCIAAYPLFAPLKWTKGGVVLSENCNIAKNATNRVSFPDGCPIKGEQQHFDLQINSFNPDTDYGDWTCSQQSSSSWMSQTTTLSKCVTVSVWIVIAVVALVVGVIVAVVVGCVWYKKRRRAMQATPKHDRF